MPVSDMFTTFPMLLKIPFTETNLSITSLRNRHVRPLSLSSVLTIMGLSGRVTVHFGTSFTSKRTGTPKPLKIKLNKSRRQLAQEQEQQKRRIASKSIIFNL
jgi:hypothetical protein